MQIKYDKLWYVLAEKNITLQEMRDDIKIGGSTVTRLNRNESVTLETIGAICEYLGCNIQDVVEIQCNPEMVEFYKQKRFDKRYRKIEHKIS